MKEIIRNYKTSNNYTDDDNYNTLSIRSTIAYLQAKIKTDGFITVNDADKAFGFSETIDGHFNGWQIDPYTFNIENFIRFIKCNETGELFIYYNCDTMFGCKELAGNTPVMSAVLKTFADNGATTSELETMIKMFTKYWHSDRLSYE